MSDHDALQGEQYSHKVSAEYDSQQTADSAVKLLVDSAGLPLSQIKVVRPHDPGMARKVEPEGRGIARTLVKTHVIMGLAGLVVGLVVAAVLVAFGPAVTRSSPVMTFIALGFFFTIVPLLFAGAISMRPDHDLLIEKTRMATDTGHWTVVVHCVSHKQQELVKSTIGHSAQTL